LFAGQPGDSKQLAVSQESFWWDLEAFDYADQLAVTHPAQQTSDSPGLVIVIDVQRRFLRGPETYPAPSALVGHHAGEVVEGQAVLGQQPGARFEFRLGGGRHYCCAFKHANFTTTPSQIAWSIDTARQRDLSATKPIKQFVGSERDVGFGLGLLWEQLKLSVVSTNRSAIRKAHFMGSVRTEICPLRRRIVRLRRIWSGGL
jgi:hypothetical protein